MPKPPNYEIMGIAAMIPGFQAAVDILQSQLDEMREKLGALQNGNAPKKPGRPRKEQPPVETGELNARGKPLKSGYWATLTPEERSAEMRRRREVQKANKPTHPRDPRHPDHEAWLKKLRRVAVKRWDAKTPAQKKAHLAKMIAGRNGEKLPSAKLAVAS